MEIMNIRQINTSLRSVQDYLAHKETEYTQLYDQYQGVRPGWVSAELAIMNAEIQSLKNEITKIEKTFPREWIDFVSAQRKQNKRNREG